MSDHEPTRDDGLSRAMQAVVLARHEMISAAQSFGLAKARAFRTEAEHSQAFEKLREHLGNLPPDTLVVSPCGWYGYRIARTGETHCFRLLTCEAYLRLHADKSYPQDKE